VEGVVFPSPTDGVVGLGVVGDVFFSVLLKISDREIVWELLEMLLMQ
jgi:hypothetical protein